MPERPTRQLSEVDFAPYEKLIRSYAKKTARAMKPWLMANPSVSLNNRAQTYDDIRQEYWIAVWQGIEAYEIRMADGEFAKNVDARTEGNFVVKCMNDMHADMLKQMWAQKEGQEYVHEDSAQSERIFNGDFSEQTIEALRKSYG